MAKQKIKKTVILPTHNLQLYTFEAFIISGPMTKSFIKNNKVVSRTVQILGNQTLEQLHQILFKAFDRQDEHMYEFQIGGQGPMDPKARRYGLNTEEDLPLSDSELNGDVGNTTISSLGLEVDEAFGYWFDFGDDWWHQITVVSIDNAAEQGDFPKVIKRVGKSPPQYML
jgi:hypothetical protein